MIVSSLLVVALALFILFIISAIIVIYLCRGDGGHGDPAKELPTPTPPRLRGEPLVQRCLSSAGVLQTWQ